MSENLHGGDVSDWPLSVLTEGTIVIKRYLYKNVNGSAGVQWIVHTVKDGDLVQLTAKDSRRAAAEYVEKLSRQKVKT